MRWLLHLCTLFPLAGLGAAQEAGGLCPNQKATLEDGRVENVGEESRCGVGIKLFGYSISAFGPRCWEHKVLYPAHGVCNGEELFGAECKKDSDMPVTRKDCRCDALEILGSGLALPDCICGGESTWGEVEHFETEECPFPAKELGTADPTSA